MSFFTGVLQSEIEKGNHQQRGYDGTGIKRQTNAVNHENFHLTKESQGVRKQKFENE